jgi:hypothetical protein
MVSRREQYVVVAAGDHTLDPAAHCAAVIDVLRGSTAIAAVDAYSDFADQMPADIRSAEAWLRGRGLANPEGDPGLAIEVIPADEVGWAIARAYAPWATRVLLFDADGIAIATLQHGGRFITVNLTPARADAVARALGPAATLAPLSTDEDDRVSAHPPDR